LFPNPVGGQLFVLAMGKQCEKSMDIQIYDINGKMVARQQMDSSLQRISTENLTSGIYWVRIISAVDPQLVYQSKFVVTR